MENEAVLETLVETKVNPFDAGVTYPTFLKALGKTKIETYLKDICTEEQIEWLKKDLEIYKTK